MRIRNAIKDHPKESRKEWMLEMFKKAGLKNSNNSNWQFWQQHNQPIELWDNYMIDNKLGYLHNNPVVARIVDRPEDYVYSSARDYADEKGMIEVELLN